MSHNQGRDIMEEWRDMATMGGFGVVMLMEGICAMSMKSI